MTDSGVPDSSPPSALTYDDVLLLPGRIRPRALPHRHATR